MSVLPASRSAHPDGLLNQIFGVRVQVSVRCRTRGRATGPGARAGSGRRSDARRTPHVSIAGPGAQAGAELRMRQDQRTDQGARRSRRSLPSLPNGSRRATASTPGAGAARSHGGKRATSSTPTPFASRWPVLDQRARECHRLVDRPGGLVLSVNRPRQLAHRGPCRRCRTRDRPGHGSTGWNRSRRRGRAMRASARFASRATRAGADFAAMRAFAG